MKTNRAVPSITPRTHEGGAAGRQSPLEALTRAVSTCLLWENTFYEKGSDQAQRIAELAALVTPEALGALAVRARTDLKLRHVPLFLAREMVRLHDGKLVGDTLAAVCQRPDELTEFLALYWKDAPACDKCGGKVNPHMKDACAECGGYGKINSPLAKQVKRGLGLALRRFNEYQLAKWNRAGAVRLKAVVDLCHPEPKDAEQKALWKRLLSDTLATPDTWEVALAAGADKKATWERLLGERKLGYMALLQNLRNMTEAKVDADLVEQAIRDGGARSKALPFRFIAAAAHAPQYAAALSDAMVSAIQGVKLPGSTAVIVDVSGSMSYALSQKSTMTRLAAASALAVLFRETANPCRIFTFSRNLVEVPNYRGLSLVEAISKSQEHDSTNLVGALDYLRRHVIPEIDRLVVVTDEQTHDGNTEAWAEKAYLVNVAGYQPGLDLRGGWKRISGWSERLVDWMAVEETGVALGDAEDE